MICNTGNLGLFYFQDFDVEILFFEISLFIEMICLNFEFNSVVLFLIEMKCIYDEKNIFGNWMLHI